MKVVKEAEAVIFQARKKVKDVPEVTEETQDSLKQLLARIRQVQKTEAKMFNTGTMIVPNQAEGNPFYTLIEDV